MNNGVCRWPIPYYTSFTDTTHNSDKRNNPHRCIARDDCIHCPHIWRDIHYLPNNAYISPTRYKYISIDEYLQQYISLGDDVDVCAGGDHPAEAPENTLRSENTTEKKKTIHLPGATAAAACDPATCAPS